MNELITQLFEAYGYGHIPSSNNTLFKLNEDSRKTDFWLVVTTEQLSSILELQASLFEACNEIETSPELDKNLSMLILWDTGGDLEIHTMKKQIVAIEEDPYFFKKHVLYFSNREFLELRREIDRQNITEFFNENIPSKEAFATYKNNAATQSWQALMYRITIKVPFIFINVNENESLESLFSQNQTVLSTHQDRSLNGFNEAFFSIDLDDLDDIDAEVLLTRLSPLLEEPEDAN
ncbi:MAG: hypothetical protein PHE67_03535 [Campylobacterales bacterium]|nr:hypothetical protein [Campylobacterales bacterium]